MQNFVWKCGKLAKSMRISLKTRKLSNIIIYGMPSNYLEGVFICMYFFQLNKMIRQINEKKKKELFKLPGSRITLCIIERISFLLPFKLRSILKST